MQEGLNISVMQPYMNAWVLLQSKPELHFQVARDLNSWQITYNYTKEISRAQHIQCISRKNNGIKKSQSALICETMHHPETSTITNFQNNKNDDFYHFSKISYSTSFWKTNLKIPQGVIVVSRRSEPDGSKKRLFTVFPVCTHYSLIE